MPRGENAIVSILLTIRFIDIKKKYFVFFCNEVAYGRLEEDKDCAARPN